MEMGDTMVRGLTIAVKNDHPHAVEIAWLARGLKQPGGKLPLFDEWGQKVSSRTVRFCIDHGWAEPWFTNPLKPDWLVCKLTDAGRKMLEGRGE